MWKVFECVTQCITSFLLIWLGTNPLGDCVGKFNSTNKLVLNNGISIWKSILLRETQLSISIGFKAKANNRRIIEEGVIVSLFLNMDGISSILCYGKPMFHTVYLGSILWSSVTREFLFSCLLLCSRGKPSQEFWESCQEWRHSGTGEGLLLPVCAHSACLVMKAQLPSDPLQHPPPPMLHLIENVGVRVLVEL